MKYSIKQAFFLLFLATSALSANISDASTLNEEDTYELVVDKSTASKIKIKIIDKQSCITSLEKILPPQKILGSFFEKIEKINQKNPESFDCIGIISDNFTDFFNDTKFILPPNFHFLNEGFFYKNYKLINDLEKKKICYNPYPNKPFSKEKFNEYKNIYENHCKNQWLNSEEYKKISEESDKEITPSLNAYSYWKNNYSDFNSSSSIRLRTTLKINMSFELSKNISNILTEKKLEKINSLSKKYFNKETSEEDREAVKKDAISFFNELSKDAEKIAEKIDNAKKENLELFSLLNLAVTKSYNMRRLIARFNAYLKNLKENTPNINNFCENYEIEQQRDKKLAKYEYLAPLLFKSKVDWNFASNYGLTEGELSSIKYYTNNFYTIINPALWKKKLDEKLHTYKNALDQGLDKIPSYTATPVIRYSNLPKNVLNEHQVGKIVTYDAYTSTSKKTNWAWVHGGNNRFVIYPGKNGKNIQNIALFTAEEEVLFKANTRFKVLSKKKNGNGFDFVLAEVDESGNVIASVPEKTEEKSN